MYFKTTSLAFTCLFMVTWADKQLFGKFMVDHDKTYRSLEEQAHRYNIFKDNLKKIDQHNEKFNAGLVSWELGVNQFADLTTEEFKNYLGTFPVANFTHKNAITYTAPLDTNVPLSIDWRSKGAVTGVKNQGQCGGCWAFSATGATESHYFIKNGKLISFSEQQLMDCAVHNSGYNCNGCSGGAVQSALDYVRDHGLETESAYPYQTKQSGRCSAATSKIVVKTKGYVEIGANNEKDLKSAVGLHGPVSVALNADLWQHYKSGIFSDTSCSTQINHGVVAVGFGKESGHSYWIIKNSWGTNFGEQGYIRMSMGHNLCGLASQACYPIF